jgi:hypothetical protein
MAVMGPSYRRHFRGGNGPELHPYRIGNEAADDPHEQRDEGDTEQPGDCVTSLPLLPSVQFFTAAEREFLANAEEPRAQSVT